MSWNYSGDPSNSVVDEIRFIIGDTDPDNPLLSDEEIIYAYEQKGSVKGAALVGLDSILTQLGRVVTKSFGPERVQYSDMFKNFKLLRDMLSSELNSGGAPEMEEPRKLIFDIGFMDNV